MAARWLADSPIKPWNAEQLACLVFLSLSLPLFFISPNLIAIFQSGMTWWKQAGGISIIWITIYMPLTKHLHLLICDFSIKVCPAQCSVHAKGNIMRGGQGLFISPAILLPPFYIFMLTFIMEIWDRGYYPHQQQLLLSRQTSWPRTICPPPTNHAARMWPQYGEYICILWLAIHSLY